MKVCEQGLTFSLIIFMPICFSTYRCNMGEDCVSVCSGRRSSCGLCSPRASSDGAHHCRLHGRVCSQEPCVMVEEERRLGKKQIHSFSTINSENILYLKIFMPPSPNLIWHSAVSFLIFTVVHHMRLMFIRPLVSVTEKVAVFFRTMLWTRSPHATGASQLWNVVKMNSKDS